MAARTLPRVVVVDDDRAVLSVVRMTLEDAGFVVQTQTSAAEALEEACTRPPALVVTDLLLPEMSGGELVGGLRAHPATSEVPVLVCSAAVDTPTARDVDADAWLEKPFEPDDLVELVRSLTRGELRRRRGPEGT
ncbi:MAG: response regulator [Actinomycetes bacterium]